MFEEMYMNYVKFRDNLLSDVNAFIAELDAVYQDQDAHLNSKVRSFMDIGNKYGIPLDGITLE